MMMTRHALTLAALLTLSASAFAADAVAPRPDARDPSLRQNAELPRDANRAQANNAAIPEERKAEYEAWVASRQSALHYCFDPCLEKKPSF